MSHDSPPLPTTSFAWSRLPDVADPHGFAGAYVGVSNSALIVTGGSNFTDLPPWKGGTKSWYDTAFVLEKGSTEWKKLGAALPSPRGYGASFTVPGGDLFYVAGGDSARCYSDAGFLRYEGGKLRTLAAPPLPIPLMNCAGAQSMFIYYVVGGISSPTATSAEKRVFVYDNACGVAAKSWTELPPLPGPGRILPVVAVIDDALYVVSGASLAPDTAGKPARTYLTDAYRYTSTEGWKRIADVPHPVVAAPSPAVPFGNGFAIFGGDTGADVNFEPKEQHPGFSRDVLAYDISKNTWHVAGQLPLGQVTTAIVPMDGKFIIPNGEIRPATRTPIVTVATPVSKAAQ